MKYTQNQLIVMSDFDINCIIAKIQNESGVYMNDIVSQRVKDYCNSWSDMGPLLGPNNISICYDKKDFPCAFVLEDISEFREWDFKVCCFNGNVLRAAAIVYILIKQDNR